MSPTQYSLFFNISDTINNVKDLVNPVNGYTEKTTKAPLYDTVNFKFLGHIVTNIRGSTGVVSTDRSRLCQTHILLNDGIRINLSHSSIGNFPNIVQPSSFYVVDFNNINRLVTLSIEGNIGKITIN
jgi:hypothetical protein